MRQPPSPKRLTTGDFSSGRLRVGEFLDPHPRPSTQVADFKLRLGRAKRQILSLRRQLEEAQKQRDEAFAEQPQQAADAATGSAGKTLKAAPQENGHAAAGGATDAAAAAATGTSAAELEAALGATQTEAAQLRERLADSKAQLQAAQAAATAATAQAAAQTNGGHAVKLQATQRQVAELQVMPFCMASICFMKPSC